ncbi:MAG: hypothetical protein LBI58_03735 [Tannerellaceae bacterium]|nr:hypothetical protein [Tannerellaceae bacterium]
MENFWNIVHFFAYKFISKVYSTKSAEYLYHTRLGQKLLAINSRNAAMALKDLKFAYTDKRVGQSSFTAFGIMTAIPLALLFGLYDFYVLIFNSAFKIYPIVILCLLSCLFNYFLLLYKDKYVKYFKKFEKQPCKWKRKWAWISAGVILFPFLALVCSFMAMLPK